MSARQRRNPVEPEDVDKLDGAALDLRSLDGFRSLDTFLVKQNVEHFEALTGFEIENSYQVLGARGSKPLLGPLLAQESSGILARMCCGNRRPWTIRLGPQPTMADDLHPRSKAQGEVVLVVQRPFRFIWQEVKVFNGSGTNFLGSVKRMCRGYPFQRNFSIKDHRNEPLMEITCPFLSFGWDFTLREFPSGEAIGKISKKWSGVMQELFTDADNFGVGFPDDLPPAQKALVLGAVFLIDFCFFEDNEVQNQRRGRSRW